MSQYIYQSFYAKPTHKSLSRILEKISITEMKHLEILSQLLLNMGVNPKFCTYIDNNVNICNPWNSTNIKYITDIVEFLKYNILIENDTIHEYSLIIDITPNENVKEVIGRIIEDEQSHVNIFTTLLNIAQGKE